MRPTPNEAFSFICECLHPNVKEAGPTNGLGLLRSSHSDSDNVTRSMCTPTQEDRDINFVGLHVQ